MRILFITYCFPPSPAAGAVRIRNLVLHLARLGHSIDVVTVPAKNLKNATNETDKSFLKCFKGHEVGYRLGIADPTLNQDCRLLSRLAGGVMRKILRHFGYEPESLWYWAARNYLSKLNSENYDLILASGNPWVNFFLINELANKWKKPYVLDYRDLWFDQPQQPKRLPNHFRLEENKILREASGISVVSHGMKRCMEARIGEEIRISVIHNGYDSMEMGRVKPAKFNCFTLVYAGTFYEPHRTIDPIFTALSKIKKYSLVKNRWQFHYYGGHSTYVGEKILEYGLEGYAEVFKAIPRQDALSSMAGAGLNIVITSVLEHGSDADKGIVTSKIFDAIGLGNPILLIAPKESDAERVLNDSSSGRCFQGNDEEGIATFLVSCIDASPSKRRKPSAFSWDQLIVSYEELLKHSIEGFKKREPRI